MDKKAFVFGTLVKVILLIAVFGILMVATTKYWAPLVGSAADRYICKISVMLNTKTKVLGAESYFALKCKMEEINLKTADKEKIKRRLALAMYDCWWKLGEGKSDFYTDWVWFENKPQCVICSRISVSEKASIDIKEFEDYLNTENIPKQEKTYAEYFTGLEDSKLDYSKINLGSAPSITLDSNKPEYVIFFAHKGGAGFIEQLKRGVETTLAGSLILLGIGTVSSKLPGVGLLSGALTSAIGGVTMAKGVAIGATIGIVATAIGRKEEFYPGILVIPGEEVAKYCRTLL